MSGTKIGGKRAAQSNKERYGENFYVELGRKGGRASGTGGFGQGERGRELARRAGAIGGRKSRKRAKY